MKPMFTGVLRRDFKDCRQDLCTINQMTSYEKSSQERIPLFTPLTAFIGNSGSGRKAGVLQTYPFLLILFAKKGVCFGIEVANQNS